MPFPGPVPGWLLKDLRCFKGLKGGALARAIDSTGKSPDDLGKFDECYYKRGEDFTQYCLAQFHISKFNLLGGKIGLCLSQNCTPDEVMQDANNLTTEILPDGFVKIWNVSCGKHDDKICY